MNIRELIAARAASDPRLKAVLRKISDGTATLTDTAYYSDVYSDITGKMFSDNVLDLIGAEREDECIDVLRSSYDNINDICAQAQKSLDQAAGINIKPQRAPFPKERVKQIAHSLLDPTVSDSTIKRRANTGVANVSKGFHDSYIKANAKFRSDAGLRVYINRETDGKCCEWCTAMAGRYSYGSEPDDIYRRHDNCGCTVIYENGKQRQDVWSKRSWTAPEVGAGAAEPVRFTSGNAPSGAGEPVRLTKDQAAELQAKNMPKKSGKINNLSIDNSGGSGIIKSENLKMSAPLQKPPDFSKYEVKSDLKAVEAFKETVSAKLGIPISDISLDGIRNTEVLEPFINRIEQIQKETGMKMPALRSLSVIDGDETCIAGYKRYENTLYISSKYFNSKDALVDTLKEWANNGTLPQQGKTIRYLAEHETAHIRIPVSDIESEEGFEIFRKAMKRGLCENDKNIYEFYADCEALDRMGYSDKNIQDAVEYLKRRRKK
ncbi:hypothetical protein [Ruminococcus sp.]|uniref:hypothetical protein n=1 Tax=Ruminococcus sp. TaxID=41978 RepID=UPI001B4686C5|nr:hypothetical protein [Ruminococcus sp.]MBP5432326.1 hypothetical protein [Ruminococcus sp.]